jgi:hypothetical protein
MIQILSLNTTNGKERLLPQGALSVINSQEIPSCDFQISAKWGAFQYSTNFPLVTSFPSKPPISHIALLKTTRP